MPQEKEDPELKARQHHFNKHSRHFPITECSQPECKAAVKKFRKGAK